LHGTLSDKQKRHALSGAAAVSNYFHALHSSVQAFTDITMSISTHTARITGPVTYVAANGRRVNIPLGPCVVEQVDGALTDIVWGSRGQSSAALPSEEVQAAQDQGHLVLLD
jgi:hypothetical protein